MSEAAQEYKIKLKAFEGPMELLMHLIEKSKIDIYDIPVAELTEQYLAYLESMRSLDMEIASDFLVMAAKLLLIKSRMILPQLKTEEEAEEEDPREELVRRIVEYKRFKQAGNFLDGLAQVQQEIFAREPLKQAVCHLPPTNLEPQQLLQAMVALLTVKPEPVLPTAIVEVEHFSLQVQMEFIMEALASIRTGMFFSDLLRTQSPEERVVDFMAVLELVHVRAILVSQAAAFGAISLQMKTQELEVAEGEI